MISSEERTLLGSYSDIRRGIISNKYIKSQEVKNGI